MSEKRDLLRMIPSVEKVLEEPELIGLASQVPRWAIADSTREVLEEIRRVIAQGERTVAPDMTEVVTRVTERARILSRPGIRKVINATGIVIHTNLGRAILSAEALAAIQEVAASYCSLEYDLSEGSRTSRTLHVEYLLRRLLGCESAFVVNNNAGAVLLALNALAQGSQVIVSRGELVEIGGSFRLPDVMEKSGARMVDVGTTNRTRLEDYQRAITESTRVLLKVHLSNFEMRGFVEAVEARDLAKLAHRHNLIMMEDLGSGALIDFSDFGLAKEPMPQESLRDGVDVVTFSGDKLLGGPQAGVILGRSRFVEPMKKSPLARALRVDKMTLAAMEATLRHYLEPETMLAKIPTLATITLAASDIKARAVNLEQKLSAGLADQATVSVIHAESQVGGGSLPTAGLKTYALSISSRNFTAQQVVGRLRCCATPIIARIVEDQTMIDLRTVQPSEDDKLAQLIVTALAGGG